MKHSRVKEIRACASRAGVEIVSIEAKRKHVHITLTNGARVYTSLTPSDHRANLELTQDLRHAGRKNNNATHNT